MRKYVPLRVCLQDGVFEQVKKDNKFVRYVSPGIAVREKTWTGFGKQSGLLGYDDSDDRDSADANRLNVEDVNFVNELLDDDKDDGAVEEGAG